MGSDPGLGDPALYDSVLRILDHILARGSVPFRRRVVPGLSSVQVLAARHGVPLNGIGGSVLITTGRRLAAGWPAEADSVVVMLDGDPGLRASRPGPDDLPGRLSRQPGRDPGLRPAGRYGRRDPPGPRRGPARHGWIMDIYLLRRDRAATDRAGAAG
ncbi:SAM-dependent methyltransferase [Methylobacterium oryzae CBMB20]